jgi:hypothetical protein
VFGFKVNPLHRSARAKLLKPGPYQYLSAAGNIQPLKIEHSPVFFTGGGIPVRNAVKAGWGSENVTSGLV